jgi:hypothetical protein
MNHSALRVYFVFLNDLMILTCVVCVVYRALRDPDIARTIAARWQGEPLTAATSGQKLPRV